MLISALLYGCASATLQTARTNGQGNFQFAIEPGAVGVAGVPEEFRDDVPGFLPTLNLSGRYGVSDRVDIGLRIGSSSGYELQSKFLLTDPADIEGIALALAPSTTFFSLSFAGSGVYFWDTRVPLLIGIPVGRSEFTLGPRLRPVLVGASADAGTAGSASASALVLYTGGTIGFAGRAADKFRILPEIAVDIPVVGAATASADGESASDVEAGTFGFVQLSFALGFLIGGPDN